MLFNEILSNYFVLGYLSAPYVCGQENITNRPENTNYRITRNRDQQAIIWPKSSRTISGGSTSNVDDDEEQSGIYSEVDTTTPRESKLKNSLILNRNDGLTYNFVRKQRTDLLRNSKEKSSSSITFSSSNLDSDEVTKALPNKGRKLTIVTPSTAVVPRKLVLFPSTTTKRTEKTDTAFADYYNKRKPSLEVRTTTRGNIDKYYDSEPKATFSVTSSQAKTVTSSVSSSINDENEFIGESASINHRKDEKEESKQPRSFLIGRGKPLNLPLPENNIHSLKQNNFTPINKINDSLGNVSHSISVVSVKYSLSGPGIVTRQEQTIAKPAQNARSHPADKKVSNTLKQEVISAPDQRIAETDRNTSTFNNKEIEINDGSASRSEKPNVKNGFIVSNPSKNISVRTPGRSIFNLKPKRVEMATANKRNILEESAVESLINETQHLTDIDERDGKSIRNQKNVVVKLRELSKVSNFNQNRKEKEVKHEERSSSLESSNQNLMSTTPPPHAKTLYNEETNSNSQLPTSSTHNKVIIHLSNNQNYSIKIGSPQPSNLNLNDKNQHHGKIAIKTRIKTLSFPRHSTKREENKLPQQKSAPLTYINDGDDDIEGSKSQTNLKSDMRKTFLPSPHAALKEKTSTRDDEISRLSLKVDEEKEKSESNNLRNEESAEYIFERIGNNKNNNHSQNNRQRPENKNKIIVHKKLELDSKNNQIHPSGKSHRQITENDDQQIHENKDKLIPQIALNHDEKDKNRGFPAIGHSQPANIGVNTEMLSSSVHAEKENLNASSIINLKSPNKEEESNNGINSEVKRVKNVTLNSLSAMNHHATLGHGFGQLVSSRDKVSSENKVQYSVATSEDEKTYKDNKSVRNRDEHYMKETEEILQTSPSVRDYYGRGRLSGKNVEVDPVTYNKDMTNEGKEYERSSTNLKSNIKKFDLDYEEYSEDTSFFGSDSSNDEVIPSQYEDAATYHEILVGAAQDPRYEHDEYVEETEYTGKHREFFPLNVGDQETISSDEYLERKKRPHVEINAVVGISVGAFFFILLGTCKYRKINHMII